MTKRYPMINLEYPQRRMKLLDVCDLEDQAIEILNTAMDIHYKDRWKRNEVGQWVYLTSLGGNNTLGYVLDEHHVKEVRRELNRALWAAIRRFVLWLVIMNVIGLALHAVLDSFVDHGLVSVGVGFFWGFIIVQTQPLARLVQWWHDKRERGL